MLGFARKSTAKKRVYLDYAAATPVLPHAHAAYEKAAHYEANPGSIHNDGVMAAQCLARARETIALELGCKAREIIFTSGGTEANSLAIIGRSRKIQIETRKTSLDGTHWIACSNEHPSVLEAFGEIERLGGSVQFAQPDSRGIISADTIVRMLRPETAMVSIGWANGEIGTIEPISQIAQAIRIFEKAHSARIALHTDAGQAPLYVASKVHSLGVDLMTLDSGKLYGPRGVGALYVSPDIELSSILFGGRQERGLRPGTENVALASGFAAAIAQTAVIRSKESIRLLALRDAFAQKLKEGIPGIRINGDLASVLPHMLNVSIPDINSEYMVLSMDRAGIAISTKSACREGEESQSHVVEALKGPQWASSNTLRFSFGINTSEKDLAYAHDILLKSLNKNP